MSSLVQTADIGDVAATPFDVELPQQAPTGRVASVIWRKKWGILLVVLLIGLPAAGFIYRLPVYYDSEALLMVDTRKTQLSDMQATMDGVTGDILTVRTQTDILNSPALAGRVVDRLDLVHTYEVQKLLTAGPTLQQQILTVLRSWFGLPAEPVTPLTAEEARQTAISWLLGRLTIANDGHSYTVSVRVRMPAAALSAAIANAYADLYLDFMRDLKIEALGRASTWLDRQIAPLQDRVRRAEEAVEQYREQNGLVLTRTLDGNNVQAQGLTIADQQLSQINTQLVAALGELADRQARLRQAQAALQSGAGLESIPEVVAAPLIQRLREQQSELTGRVAALGQTALNHNPAMQSMQASNADLQRRIASEVGKIVASLATEVNAAAAHVDSLRQNMTRLRAQVTGQSQAEVTLRQLTSEAEAARAVYRDFLNRFEQTSSQAALQEPEADLISRAQPPIVPTGPARARLLALALIAAGVLGALIALATDRLRGGLRSPEELEADTGLFPLGFVPAAASRKRLRLEQRPSVYTGSVDYVRSMLRFGDSRYRAKVVLITSATSAEGKTFFAVSLAASVGREGARALVIDADLRRPQVLLSIGLRNDAGEAGAAATAEYHLRRAAMPGVDVMSFHRAGGLRSLPLEPAALEALIAEARGHYDLIVLDTPPVLAMPDAPVLASVVDGAILVVRWGHTPAVAVRSALRTLRAYRTRVLGGVLTQVRLEKLGPAEGGQLLRFRNAAAYFG